MAENKIIIRRIRKNLKKNLGLLVMHDEIDEMSEYERNDTRQTINQISEFLRTLPNRD